MGTSDNVLFGHQPEKTVARYLRIIFQSIPNPPPCPIAHTQQLCSTWDRHAVSLPLQSIISKGIPSIDNDSNWLSLSSRYFPGFIWLFHICPEWFVGEMGKRCETFHYHLIPRRITSRRMLALYCSTTWNMSSMASSVR